MAAVFFDWDAGARRLAEAEELHRWLAHFHGAAQQPPPVAPHPVVAAPPRPADQGGPRTSAMPQPLAPAQALPSGRPAVEAAAVRATGAEPAEAHHATLVPARFRATPADATPDEVGQAAAATTSTTDASAEDREPRLKPGLVPATLLSPSRVPVRDDSSSLPRPIASAAPVPTGAPAQRSSGRGQGVTARALPALLAQGTGRDSASPPLASSIPTSAVVASALERHRDLMSGDEGVASPRPAPPGAARASRGYEPSPLPAVPSDASASVPRFHADPTSPLSNEIRRAQRQHQQQQQRLSSPRGAYAPASATGASVPEPSRTDGSRAGSSVPQASSSVSQAPATTGYDFVIVDVRGAEGQRLDPLEVTWATVAEAAAAAYASEHGLSQRQEGRLVAAVRATQAKYFGSS